ncbi:MAG: DUF3780 domain-containing protein [Caldilineaceae bacterium]|nr:DUF3780 domain-containing protein [Caldilineaceae bacterium]
MGVNWVRRDLGKELVMLAWAVEDADPALIPNTLGNWRGLVPEERWWLYTQTAAATGHGQLDRNKGWRKALRYALTENPASVYQQGPVVPDYFRQASGKTLFGESRLPYAEEAQPHAEGGLSEESDETE